MVTYVHLLFDRHEIVVANGVPSESFHPESPALDTLSERSRDEFFRLFPALRSVSGAYGPPSRLCVEPARASAPVPA